MIDFSIQLPKKQAKRRGELAKWIPKFTDKKDEVGSFTVELKYFRSMPWYKAIFLSNFFNFILVLFRTLWYNRVG